MGYDFVNQVDLSQRRRQFFPSPMGTQNWILEISARAHAMRSHIQPASEHVKATPATMPYDLEGTMPRSSNDKTGMFAL
jgi:hypothetical protein